MLRNPTPVPALSNDEFDTFLVLETWKAFPANSSSSPCLAKMFVFSYQKKPQGESEISCSWPNSVIFGKKLPTKWKPCIFVDGGAGPDLPAEENSLPCILFCSEEQQHVAVTHTEGFNLHNSEERNRRSDRISGSWWPLSHPPGYWFQLIGTPASQRQRSNKCAEIQ